MSLRRALTGLACALAMAVSPEAVVAASGPEGPRVRVELVSEVAGIAPGTTFWVALHQRIAPGWHT
jgi:DsbC/DsbD-like thiol-disulfide interchange protein